MVRLTGFEPATFGSGVIGARGINNLHSESLSATGLYFQDLTRGCVHSVALHQCRGSPQNPPQAIFHVGLSRSLRGLPRRVWVVGTKLGTLKQSRRGGCECSRPNFGTAGARCRNARLVPSDSILSRATFLCGPATGSAMARFSVANVHFV